MSSPESLTTNTPFLSGRLRAGIVIFFLAAYIAVGLLAIVSSLMHGSFYSGMAAGADVSDEQATLLQMLSAGVALLFLVVYIGCIVAFCFWIHRAYRNLRALGNPQTSLEHSPGWAVGFFFIPFANLVMPYRVVKEIWVKSDPRVRTQQDYLYAPPVSTALVLAWWLMWIASNVLVNGADRLSGGSTDPSTLAWMANLDIVANSARVVAAVLAILVVRGIDRRQEERSKYVLYAASAPPPPPVFTTPPPPPVFAPPQPGLATGYDAPAPPPGERTSPE